MTSQLSFWKRLFGRGATPSDARGRRGHPEYRPGAGTADQPDRAGAPDRTGSAAGADAQAGSLKALRASRREQLFTIVRENMVRAGVLPTAYKFKILTLDRQAQDFIVLCDIQPSAFDGHPDVLARLETSLKQLARERMNVGVRSVYWRHAEVIGRSRSEPAPLAPRQVSAHAQSYSASPSQSHPQPHFPPADPAAARPAPPAVVVPAMTEDAVTEEEVLALKRALSEAGGRGAVVARRPAGGTGNAQGTAPATAAATAAATAVVAGAGGRASVSASSVPEWKRRDFAPTQPMADDEEDSLYMPLSETQLGRLD